MLALVYCETATKEQLPHRVFAILEQVDVMASNVNGHQCQLLSI